MQNVSHSLDRFFEDKFPVDLFPKVEYNAPHQLTKGSEMSQLTVNMVSAVKVQFLKPIFEEDFPEKGMTAWLTDVEWDSRSGCYKLYFDFSEFEDINLKYFKRMYHPNRHTHGYDESRKLFTAIEAGYYESKYSVYFSTKNNDEKRDDEAFARDIQEYLRVPGDMVP